MVVALGLTIRGYFLQSAIVNTNMGNQYSSS